jgi:hypothetical protein
MIISPRPTEGSSFALLYSNNSAPGNMICAFRLRAQTSSPCVQAAHQTYSTAFLVTELTRLSDRLIRSVTKLTSMRAHVTSCEQKGLFILNQTQVIFAIKEHLEFLARHVLVDPYPGSPGVLPSAGVAKSRRQAERLDALDALHRLERSIAAETANFTQNIAVTLATGSDSAEVGRTESGADDIGGHHEDEEVAEENAPDGKEGSRHCDGLNGSFPNTTRGASVEQVQQVECHHLDIADGRRPSGDMGDEILDDSEMQEDAIPDRETVVEEEDLSDLSDPPDDNENNAALNLKPTVNLLLVLSLLSEGLSYAPVHRCIGASVHRFLTASRRHTEWQGTTQLR